MKKVENKINKYWQYNFEQNDFNYHSLDGKYWIDNYHLELTEKEVEDLKIASNEVHSMCMEMLSENIRAGNLAKYGLKPYIINAMESSWKKGDFQLYGRFDFAYDGTGIPKMLEYNADTPTSIVESSIAQSLWQKMQKDDFNVDMKMCNNLENAFKKRFSLWKSMNEGKNFYFASDELILEDWDNVIALKKWAREVGINAETINLDELMYDFEALEFQNTQGEKIDALFKLYPWEFIFNDLNFGDYEVTSTQIVEPMWKGFLSTKAILPMLWDMYKGHKNLMPAYFTENEILQVTNSYVKKPIYSREGANIEVIKNKEIIDQEVGIYGSEGYVYQEYAKMANLDNAWYVFGTWMIGNNMEGLSIREDKTIITKKTSYFVPHNIV